MQNRLLVGSLFKSSKTITTFIILLLIVFLNGCGKAKTVSESGSDPDVPQTGYIQDGRIIVYDLGNKELNFAKTDHVVESLDDYNNSSYPLMASLPDQDIQLYGVKPKDSDEALGVVLVQGKTAQYFNWEYLTPRLIMPRLAFGDFGHDGQREIAVMLYNGSGTGVSIEELHIVEIITNRAGKTIFENHQFLAADYVKQLERILKYTINSPGSDGYYSITLHVKNKDYTVPCKQKEIPQGLRAGSIVAFETKNDQIQAVFALETFYENMATPQFEAGLAKLDVFYKNGKFTLSNLSFNPDEEFSLMDRKRI